MSGSYSLEPIPVPLCSLLGVRLQSAYVMKCNARDASTNRQNSALAFLVVVAKHDMKEKKKETTRER